MTQVRLKYSSLYWLRLAHWVAASNCLGKLHATATWQNPRSWPSRDMATTTSSGRFRATLAATVSITYAPAAIVRSVRIAAGRDCTAKNAGNICQVANTSGLPQLVTAQGLGSGATFQKRTLPPPRLARQNSHAFAS